MYNLRKMEWISLHKWWFRCSIVWKHWWWQNEENDHSN